MSISEIKNEVERLKPEDRRHLIAFLLSLEGGLPKDVRADLSHKIDDRRTEQWITLSDAKSRFGDS